MVPVTNTVPLGPTSIPLAPSSRCPGPSNREAHCWSPGESAGRPDAPPGRADAALTITGIDTPVQQRTEARSMCAPPQLPPTGFEPNLAAGWTVERGCLGCQAPEFSRP